MTQCPDCRVALVPDEPASLDDGDDGGLVELGEWPRVQAQVLRRRLETAGVSVMIEWSGPASERDGDPARARGPGRVRGRRRERDRRRRRGRRQLAARVRRSHRRAPLRRRGPARRAAHRSSTSSRPTASSDIVKGGASLRRPSCLAPSRLRGANDRRSVLAQRLVARCPVVREVREQRPPRHGHAGHDESGAPRCRRSRSARRCPTRGTPSSRATRSRRPRSRT